MRRSEALPLAQSLLADLEPVCKRIEIAGSIRREKPDVGDIELVLIPEPGELVKDRDLFGEVVAEHYRNGFDDWIGFALAHGGWDWQLDPVNRRNGDAYKRLQHVESGVCADLFIVDERSWGGALAIRTGPADFSQALVTIARRQNKCVASGYLLHAHPKHGDRGCDRGKLCPLIKPTPEESDFLEALGLDWIEPPARKAELAWRMAKREAIG